MSFVDYKPNIFLRNGHFNTIYPTLFRNQEMPEYKRYRIVTYDNDFLDVDFLKKGNKRLVILCHGLEGSSSSKYIIGTAGKFHENNWDVAAINYRGCSGEINDKLKMYHSGATYDLQTIVDFVYQDYEEIILIGFSLGGNLCLKFAGEKEQQIENKISKVIAVSVPVDLKAGSINIGRRSNYIYEKQFLNSLSEKIKLKHEQFPQLIDLGLLEGMTKLYDFDDVFTGPIHGFGNADNYYKINSSKQFIGAIRIPTLIVNALDDPFLPKTCYPYKEAANNKHIKLLTPKYGGHVGFVNRKEKYYWIEERIFQWVSKNT